MLWHIGKMKTASTFMQHGVYSRSSDIFYLGWYTKLAQSQWFNKDVEQLVWDIRYSSDFDVEKWKDLVSRFDKVGEVVLISDEGIGTDIGNWQRNLLRIKQVDPAARVFWCVREQYSYLLSQYYQYRRGVFGNKRWAHVSLRDFLADGGRGFDLAKDLFYDTQVTFAQNLLGQSNVLVLPYELLGSDPQDFILRQSKFLGIDSDKMLRLALDSQPVYQRPSSRFKNISKFISTVGDGELESVVAQLPFLRRLVYRHYNLADITKLLDGTFPGFRASNKNLSQLLDIELDVFGY